MKKISIAASLVGLFGCVSPQPMISRAPAEVKVSFLYQSNRQGELEPCGCHAKPFGGIDREANAVGKARAESQVTWYIDAGNLFSPAQPTRGKAHQQRKARALAGMLSGMGLEVFSPGPNDYALGVSFLKEVAGSAKFKFLGTNVSDKSGKDLFARYLVEERKGVRFGFLSLTPAMSDSPEVVVMEADQALAQYLPVLEKQSDFIVLLSQMGTANDEKLAAKYPVIRLIVGSDPSAALEEPFWFDGHTLMLDPHLYGYQLGRLDLTLRTPFRGFYSDRVIAANHERMATWEGRLREDPSNEAAKSYLAKIKAQDSLAPIPGGTTYENQLISLDEKTYGTKNGVTKSISEYKAGLRSAALKSLAE